MTQTSEIAQSTEDLWATYEGLLAEYDQAREETDTRHAAYEVASEREREAWDASLVAYATYRTAVDGGRK